MSFYNPLAHTCEISCDRELHLVDPILRRRQLVDRVQGENYDWVVDYDDLTCVCEETFIMSHNDDHCWNCRHIDADCVDCAITSFGGNPAYQCEICDYNQLIMPNQLERIDGGETTICEPKLVGCKILEDDQPYNLPDPIDRDGDGYHDWWCP